MQCFSITVILTGFALGNGKRIQHFLEYICKLTSMFVGHLRMTVLTSRGHVSRLLTFVNTASRTEC
jgi:hypothetical protein